MKLILARHGETIENREGILQEPSFGTLSEKGIEQAKRLGLRLKGEHLDAIYSSRAWNLPLGCVPLHFVLRPCSY